jgi:hypothetical protein
MNDSDSTSAVFSSTAKKERFNEYKQELEKLVEMRAEMDRKIEELRKKIEKEKGLL